MYLLFTQLNVTKFDNNFISPLSLKNNYGRAFRPTFASQPLSGELTVDEVASPAGRVRYLTGYVTVVSRIAGRAHVRCWPLPFGASPREQRQWEPMGVRCKIDHDKLICNSF